MRKLKYGGDLHPGDFIAVSEGNRIFFGWYFGDGRGGTLQYYYIGAPSSSYNVYQNWENIKDPEIKSRHWSAKKYSKGFSLKCIYKSYINAVHNSRVVKITNPEDIFTDQEDRQEYEKSKEILIKLKFIKQ
jgi:hypothetical protein